MLTIALALAAAPYEPLDAPTLLAPVDSVYLPELTWPDVRDALQAGKTTLLVPTGGVEQNGPFLALGKHDLIAREVAERTARALGDALVAPVVSFVPEGRIYPREGHMNYPGTLSVRASTFEALLEDVAESYQAHGFTHIVFLGDSGGNQEPQLAVAERLDGHWAGVRVLHIPEFYDPDAANAFLVERGIEWKEDGYHDDPGFTLQLLAVDADAARGQARVDAGLTTTDGFSLEPLAARASLGSELMDWRSERTAEAIRTAREAPRSNRLGAWALETATRPFGLVLDRSQRVYWLYLFTGLMMAVVAEIYRQGRSWSLGSILPVLFPKRVLTSRDLRNDVVWMLFGGFALYGLFDSFAALTAATTSTVIERLYWLVPSPALPAHWAVIAVSTLFLALVTDFTVYWAHRIQHDVSALWTFHQVHHSAVELNPLTVYRMHPVDLMLNAAMGSLFLGSAVALLTWVFDSQPHEFNVAGVNLVVFVFYLFGYNLRHTHYWLSFGPLDRVFVSPAMHQIHHSADPKHWDKNMGLVFSIWDQMFGTAYIPTEHEQLTFGIGEAGERFRTAWDFLAEPFRQLVRKT